MLDIKDISTLDYKEGLKLKREAILKLFSTLPCFCKEFAYASCAFGLNELDFTNHIYEEQDDYTKDPLAFKEELVEADEEYALFLKDASWEKEDKFSTLADAYATQKERKTSEKELEFLEENFGEMAALADEKSGFSLSLYDIQKSAFLGYRNRAELSIWRENGELFYAMHKGKAKYIVKDLPLAAAIIRDFMPKLLKCINENEFLSHKLFAVEFLSSKDELCSTLIYHKNVEDFKDKFESFAKREGINLTIRSRKKKLVFGKDSLETRLDFNDKSLKYRFTNDSFIQPNTAINEAMLAHLDSILAKQSCQDLLELYCGFGNFTLALASHFKRVLATEISKENIRLAKENLKLNNILNVYFARLSAAELKSALNKEREFSRLKDVNLNSFCFSHILVDPPRAGLGEQMCGFCKDYDNIIYISCNPQSLKEDLSILCKTHDVLSFKGFDQFPLTPHLENIICLKRR